MDDLSWKSDLTLCLTRKPDLKTLRETCKGRKIPDELRHEVWKSSLNIVGKPDALANWDGMLDTNEQDVLREDCILEAGKLKLMEEDEEEVARDMEGLITFFCKSKNDKYRSSSGLVELLSPLITLNLPLSDVYNCLYAMHSKYVPRECYRDGRPFHLFRQLLQYHDPSLCSYLDSRKIPPDLYAQKWLRGLFVATCDLDVIRAMWDIYLLEGDTFFVFYLMLVMVLNAKEQILELADCNKSTIVDMVTAFPSQLGVDDIEDFCTLAQYYATRTPQSYRQEYQSLLFGNKLPVGHNNTVGGLCLQVNITEVIQVCSSTAKEELSFFLVDCRPSDQYNHGHLPTAFHLDANLMLQAPEEFSTAVEALFATQQQAIEAGSSAAGEHLVFMGSGRENEDQYVNMVIANFLQRGTHFVSIAKGGYQALHDLLSDDLSGNLVDHDPRYCIVCSPESAMSSEDESHEVSRDLSPTPVSPKTGIVDKLSTSLRSRGANVKERLGRLMSDKPQIERHVTPEDKIGRRYRGGVNMDIFSIDDDDDSATDTGGVTSGEDDRNQPEAINIDTWSKRADVIRSIPCSQISQSGHMFSSYILLTSTNLLIIKEIVDKDRPGWGHVQGRPHLSSVVKITSKRKHPDLITFRYGTSNSDGEQEITSSQRFLIPNSKAVTKIIKERIMKLMGDE